MRTQSHHPKTTPLLRPLRPFAATSSSAPFVCPDIAQNPTPAPAPPPAPSVPFVVQLPPSRIAAPCQHGPFRALCPSWFIKTVTPQPSPSSKLSHHPFSVFSVPSEMAAYGTSGGRQDHGRASVSQLFLSAAF